MKILYATNLPGKHVLVLHQVEQRSHQIDLYLSYHQEPEVRPEDKR